MKADSGRQPERSHRLLGTLPAAALLKMARAALIYLSLAAHAEEHERPEPSPELVNRGSLCPLSDGSPTTTSGGNEGACGSDSESG